MTAEETGTLLRLDDSDQTLADPVADIRGRKVIDRNGEEVGEASALLIDDKEHSVRFLEVESGGFLGLGEKTSFIPVDAVTTITAYQVKIDRTR